MESSEENENTKKNPDVELKEYQIQSKFFDEGDEHIKSFTLPTIESLEKLCSLALVKDILTFDREKYKSYFNENNILNLDKVESIKNKELVPYVLIFIGGINSSNDIFDFFEETINNPDESSFIDNSTDYFQYLNSIIDYLKSVGKLDVSFTSDLLFNALDEIGINIHKDDKNVLYRNINDAFLSMEKNKILVILAPSNNFWVKSEKNTINEQNYDIKLNNHSNIFYNKKFIKKFFEKVTNHPRCSFGLLCSMNYKNLKNCWDGLEKQFSKECPKKVILFDQKDHEEIMLDQNKKKPTFLRKMSKIIEHLKKEKQMEDKKKGRYENEEEAGDNVLYFSEKNILILESEMEKMDDTKPNSIFVNLFSEQYLGFDEKGKEAIDLEGDKVINYINKLFENCHDDIRIYINKNKITDEYSKV
jgi:hypothetical protein